MDSSPLNVAALESSGHVRDIGPIFCQCRECGAERMRDADARNRDDVMRESARCAQTRGRSRVRLPLEGVSMADA